MKPKIPLGYALTILLLACAIGWHLGTWAAGPMPVIDRTPPEPERNYTQETLRILNPPPRPSQETVTYPGGASTWGWGIATTNIYNSEPRQ